MPPPNAKQKEVNTQPSPGLLERIFGSGKFNPTMQQGIELAKKENPNLGDVQPYGFFSRLLQGNNEAYTSPGRTVYLNTDHFQNGYTPQDIATTLAHEQSHVQQMRDRALNPMDETVHQLGNIFYPYQQNPDEVAAYSNDVARARALHMGDPPIPDFVTGEMRPPLDTAPSNIRRPKPQVGINTGPSRSIMGIM